MENRTKKTTICLVILAIILSVALSIGLMWYNEMFIFRETTPNKKTIPNTPPKPKPAPDSEFFFVVNDKIGDHKAANALFNLKKKKSEEETINGLNSKAKWNNSDSFEVIFTNIDNIGLILHFAELLKNNKAILDFLSYINGLLKDKPSDEVSLLLNLLTELGCHIELCRGGGEISLKEYNAYLYTNFKDFKEKKDTIEAITNIKEKIKSEKKLFMTLVSKNKSSKNMEIISGAYWELIGAYFKE